MFLSVKFKLENMYFELNKALIDNILFSMEDQRGIFLLDTQKGIVVSSESEKISSDERYITLPEWNSANGFRLMENFITNFKNPLIQYELNVALDQGKGVFRSFKDTLSRYPSAEKRWFSFKEREMKRIIIEWYNAYRDAWGLERIGEEPEETFDLVLSDFIFRKPKEKDLPYIEELHREVLEEANNFSESLRGEVVLVAETIECDFAGYIEIIQKDKTLHINALEVRPEFRGLGVGEELCSQFLDTIDRNTVSAVTVDLNISSESFSRVLLRKSFKPYATRYCLNLM